MTYFYNFGTLYIYGMGIARAFKFGTRIDRQAYKPKNSKVGERVMAYVTWHTFIILGPLCVSEMGKVKNDKFGARIDRQVYKPKMQK